jgi:hypothetical protein
MVNDPDNCPVSQLVADRGIKTSGDLVDFLGALLSDIVAQRVDYEQSAAVCNVAQKILDVAEFQINNLDSSQDGLLGRKVIDSKGPHKVLQTGT